jgi:subtilisin family serine protease
VHKPVYIEKRVPAEPNETVHFTVIPRPSTGIGLDELRDKLHVRTIDACLPNENDMRVIAGELELQGFHVFNEDMSLHVSAEGTVARFEAMFKTQLEKHTRQEANLPAGRGSYVQHWFAIKAGAPAPQMDKLPGALAIALPPAPIWFAPRFPPAFPGLTLRVPGDIAQLLMASATHREMVGGNRATGGGIKVAVIDSGFAHHPYFEDHGYHITRAAASDTSSPAVDPEQHGTAVLANMLACAPDVSAIGVKKGALPELAFSKARSFKPNVISFSVGYDLGPAATLPVDYLPLATQIVDAVAKKTVVVVAAGNFGVNAFPAMMPETLAVGGAIIDAADQLSVANTSSSFAHPIYPARHVPDICGFGMDIILPIPDPLGAPDWTAMGYTSCATPQVAGVCALLIQNNPSLTPQTIRSVLIETAQDIRNGVSANGEAAGLGIDLATGGGLVNALMAWKGVGLSG